MRARKMCEQTATSAVASLDRTGDRRDRRRMVVDWYMDKQKVYERTRGLATQLINITAKALAVR